jgi:hypothetical protein
MLYACQKLSAWWVVYKVNPRERLHTPDDAGYHEKQVEASEVQEVYQVLGTRVRGLAPKAP